MRKLLLLSFLVSPVIWAEQSQRLISIVRGSVSADESLAGNHLMVALIDSQSHQSVAREYVASDGTFVFRDVPAGSYTVELSVQSGIPIRTESVNLSSGSDQIDLLLPKREKSLPAGTVSVQQLRQPPPRPMSAKSKRMFAGAEKASAVDDYPKAIEILRATFRDPSAVPYARMNIGVAYLRAGQPASAIPELKEAVRLLPGNALAHSNLAYAYLLLHDVHAAELECRAALHLDPDNSKAHWILGSILLSKDSQIEEAVADLHFASREIPTARVILAQYYQQKGQKDAAVRELREYLPQSGERHAAIERWLSQLASK